jgi:hypothetical protein
MKSFKEYLTESKKVYEFKVKIAGECPSDCSSQIKSSLAQFHVASVSAGKRTPIQERHSEFPEHKNVNMTVFDVTTDYPATSLQIRDMLSAHLGMPLSNVKVKSLAEELEHEINHQHDKRTGKAIIGTPTEASDHSDLVGEKHKMNFLQELNKEKHQGTQIKGYNDEILADGVPGLAKEYRKTKDSTVEKAHKSPVAKAPIDMVAKVMGAR